MTMVNIEGKQYVIVEAEAYDRLLAAAAGEELPALPEPDRDGLRPAAETMKAIMARTIMRRRLAARLTQQEVAERAGVRVETISRLESGKHRPRRATIIRIDDALTAAGA